MDDSKRIPVKFDDEIFLRGETYYYRGTPPGTKTQIEKSLKIKKGAAQKDILKAKRAIVDASGNLGSRAGKNSFAVLADRYIKNRWEEAKDPNVLSEHSAYESEQILTQHMIPFFGNKRVDELEQIDFADYCAIKFKNLNLVNHRKVINHFMKWCVHESVLKYRVQFEIPKKFHKPRRGRVVLTDEEVTKLIKAVVEMTNGNRRLWKTRLYVMFYLLMGVRNKEICRLRWDEVSFEKNALKINKWSNRKRKERAIPINSYCLQVLKEEYSLKASDWVFPSGKKNSKYPHMSPEGGYRKGWVKALDKAGIDRHITPHDLRATFETFMHTNNKLTDTQREKMAGAAIDVQKNIYVTMDVDHLRGAEESVNLPAIKKIFREKPRAKRAKKEHAKLPTKRNNKRKQK